MQYLKLFDTTSEYNNYAGSVDYIEPNVSYCENDHLVFFNSKKKLYELIISANGPVILGFNDIKTECFIKSDNERSEGDYYIFIPEYDKEINGTHYYAIVDTIQAFYKQTNPSTTNYWEIKFIKYNINGNYTDKLYWYRDDLDEMKTTNLNYSIQVNFKNHDYVYSDACTDKVILIEENVNSIIGANEGLCSYVTYSKNLTSIKIPECVTIVKNYAFYGSNQLSHIELPNTITSIGDYAFAFVATSTIIYNGTMAEFRGIELTEYWNLKDWDDDSPYITTVHCIDGDLTINREGQIV